MPTANPFYHGNYTTDCPKQTIQRLSENQGIAYFDYAAHHPMTREVKKTIEEYLKSDFGNPSSNHTLGKVARDVVEEARDKILKIIGGDGKGQLIFTSGGTEANNIVMNGGTDGKIVIGAFEHASVRHASVGRSIRYNDIKDLLKDEVISGADLLSVSCVNNVLGSFIHPNEMPSDIEVLTHMDMCQAFGKVCGIKVYDLDYATISGHKIGAPTGIGALYVSNRAMLKLQPLMFGGGHEFARRPGTLPVMQILALLTAFEHLPNEATANEMSVMSQMILGEVKAAGGHLNVLGDLHSINTILSVTFPTATCNVQEHFAKRGVCLTSGSACRSSKVSPVMEDLGIDQEKTVRISFGRYTTTTDFILLRDAIHALPRG